LLVDVRLPDSASLERTQAVMAQVEAIALGSGTAAEGHDAAEQGRTGGIPGIAHTITISGQSIVQNAIGSNYGTVYVILDEFEHRHGAEFNADAIASKLRAACYQDVQEASVAVFGAPPVDGLGSAGGFKVMVRDMTGLGLDALQEAADGLAAAGNQQPGLVGLFSAFRARTPQMYVDIDRVRSKAMGIPLSEAFQRCSSYLGATTRTTSTNLTHLAGESARRPALAPSIKSGG
jgi:multidrug efflux pump